MIKFPLTTKQIRSEDYYKIKDIKPGKAVLMCHKKSKEQFVFQYFNDSIKAGDYVQIIDKIYRLFHPSILQFDGFIVSPHRILSTRYLENSSLRTMFQTRSNFSRLSPTHRSNIIFGLASAFEFLHSREVLKAPFDPSDILLSEDLQPLIQLSNLVQETKKDSQYLAPEYLSNSKYSEKSDVYTLGAILFELATETEYKSIQSINENSLKTITTTLSKDIIHRCCSTVVESRPSFSSLVDDLMNTDDPLFEGENKDEIEDFHGRNLEFSEIDEISLAKKLLKGIDLPQDTAMAAHLLKINADDGQAIAMFSYGKMLLNGEGVAENTKEARRYLEMANDIGYEKATQQLSILNRRELIEQPLIIQGKLLNLSSASHRETVTYIADGDGDFQETAAHIIIDFLRIRPLMSTKFVRLVKDINSKSSEFAQKVISSIYSNLNPFSISFLYQLYLNRILTIDDLVSFLAYTSIDDQDVVSLILSWFAPEIKESDKSTFEKLVNKSHFKYDEQIIKQKRKERHPSSPILNFIKNVNPSKIKTMANEIANYIVPADDYDPISFLLKGQSAIDYAAFVASYHIFLNIEFELTPTIVKNAVGGGSIDVLVSLKKKQADFKNALKFAVLYHQQKVFDWILNNKLDSLTADLILYAAMSNNTQFLMDYKCDPNVTDSNGENAMHLAAKNGSVDFLRILFALYENLDTNQKNNEGVFYIYF